RSSIGVQFTAPNTNPAPADTCISPSKISGSILPVEVRISGTGFQSNSVVEYDGVPTAYNFVNATSLVITLQVFQLTQGLHRIQVVNPPPGGGTSNLLELTVTSLANQAPVVNAGSDQTITLPASASLNGTASDDGLPAGSTLTTTWSKVRGPGNVTFGNLNALTTTANFSAAGTYVLRLTASDGALSSRDDVTIAVNSAGGNANPPVVDAGPARVIAFPAKDLTLFGHATDPNNDPLTVQWTSTSG